MAANDFVDIVTQSLRAAGVYIKIPSSYGISDIYHSGHTHLIGERTTEHSPHLFYTLASDDLLWFQLVANNVIPSSLPYSGLFSKQKFSYKKQNLNFERF